MLAIDCRKRSNSGSNSAGVEPRLSTRICRPRPALRRWNEGLTTTQSREKSPGPSPASRRVSPGLATTNDLLGRRLDLIHATGSF